MLIEGSNDNLESLKWFRLYILEREYKEIL